MTLPTLTYLQGLNIDCDNDTGWTRSHSGLPDAALTVVNSNIFKMTGTCDAATEEYAYWEKDVTDFSSTTYNKWMLKWRTSVASSGLGAKVVVEYDDASEEAIFGYTPQFSDSWALETGTLTTGKTVDKIQFHMNDHPNSVDSGAYSVYYDFLIFYNDTFTFPYFKNLYPLKLHNNYATIKPPGKMGVIHQYMGMDNIQLELTGDMMSGETWGGSNMTYGEYITLMFMEASTIPFQWLTSDLINCKVIPVDFEVGQQEGEDNQRQWRLILEEYSKGAFDSSDISSSVTERMKYRFGIE